jgi:hypothetical protein
MADISESRKQERAARIQRRAQNYINGDISLDTFIMLEQLDNEDEADIVEALEKERNEKEAARESAERRKEADKLRDLAAKDAAKEAKEKQKQEAPKKAQRKEPRVPELVHMTKEEFDALTLNEQQKLYELAPERVREIIEARPAYMDIIDPRPKARDYKGLTLEDFKKMTLQEMQALYNADPKLYNKLAERLDRHPKPGSKAEAETSDIVAGGFISGAET